MIVPLCGVKNRKEKSIPDFFGKLIQSAVLLDLKIKIKKIINTLLIVNPPKISPKHDKRLVGID